MGSNNTQHGSGALYNKYRPTSFDDVVGQNIPVSTMRNALTTGRVANAYLFSGVRGVGKTTSARIFAKALLCTERGENSVEPCGECPSCLGFQQAGGSPDFIELDAASNRGIDNVRTLSERIALAPQTSNRKAVLLDEAHSLTRDAVTALLKIIEEPPRGVVFLLTTTEPLKIPDTIRSRCVWLQFRTLNGSDLVGRLKAILEGEEVECEDGVCEIIARRSGGSVRDAISLLEQLLVYSGGKRITMVSATHCLGRVDDSVVLSLAKYYLENNVAEVVGFTVRNTDVEPAELTRDFGDIISNALIYKSCGELIGDGLLLSDGVQKIVAEIAEQRSELELLCMRNAIERNNWKFREHLFEKHHLFNEIMLYGMKPENNVFDAKTISRIFDGVSVCYKQLNTLNQDVNIIKQSEIKILQLMQKLIKKK